MNYDCIFIIFIFLFCIVHGKDLVYVQTIWRHGDRAPEQLPYPNDQYVEDYWPRGWAQLTNVGMGQLHELGTFFKNRYVRTFVNSSFNYKEVYFRSTDSSRALTSAQCVSNGMFPPSGYQKWDPSLNWQPIPIHATTPGAWDALLRPTDLKCQKYDNLWDDKYKHPVNDLIKKKYGDVLRLLEAVTGYGKDMSIKKAAKLIDITREVGHNMTQPSWVTMKWPEHDGNTTLDIIVEIYRLRRIAQFDSPKLALLRGGVITQDFLERLLNASKGIFNEATKMLMYSSHDGTLLSLMYSMGIGDDQLIPYGAALIFELSRDNTGNYNVEIFYRKNGNLKQLTVPGCDASCEVGKLATLLSKKIYSSAVELYKDCGMCDKNDTNCYPLASGSDKIQIKPPTNSAMRNLKFSKLY